MSLLPCYSEIHCSIQVVADLRPFQIATDVLQTTRMRMDSALATLLKLLHALQNMPSTPGRDILIKGLEVHSY